MSPVSGVAKIVKFALRNWMKREERACEGNKGEREGDMGLQGDTHNTIFGTLQ